MSEGNKDFAIVVSFYYPGLVVVVVVLVLVDVLVEDVVVVVVGVAVVVVVVVGLQHSYASISCQFPTLGLSLLRINDPLITLPVPS
jgi:hypothetical protein